MSRENVKEPMEESLEDKAYDLLGDMLVERNTARSMGEMRKWKRFLPGRIRKI